ncbi:hypothetical protein [Streptomyces adustus]
MELEIAPSNVDSVRLKLERLVERGIPIEPEHGLFTQPRQEPPGEAAAARQPRVQARDEQHACDSIRRRVFRRRVFRLCAKAASLFVGFVSAGWFDVLDNNGTDGEAAPGGRPDLCSVLVK